ncbi:unnamed protein product [Closterium sp. NIES-64]|nr:unnamed protein product [Closterium sp. NIES-64]
MDGLLQEARGVAVRLPAVAQLQARRDDARRWGERARALLAALGGKDGGRGKQAHKQGKKEGQGQEEGQGHAGAASVASSKCGPGSPPPSRLSPPSAPPTTPAPATPLPVTRTTAAAAPSPATPPPTVAACTPSSHHPASIPTPSATAPAALTASATDATPLAAPCPAAVQATLLLPSPSAAVPLATVTPATVTPTSGRQSGWKEELAALVEAGTRMHVTLGEMEQVQQQLQRMQWEEAAEGALMRRASVDELLALEAQGERLPTGSAVVARVHAVVAAGSDWQARAQRALQEGCSLEEGEAMSREAEAMPASLAGHAHLMSALASARAAAARGDQLLLAALHAEVVALPVRPPHAPQLASLLSSLAAWQSATSHALHTATTLLSPPTTVTPTTAAAAQSTQASPAAVPIATESGATPLASAPAAPAGKPPPELLVPAAAASASAAELSSLLTQGAALGVAVPELPAVRALLQRLHWEVAAHALLSGTADTAVQSGGVAQDSAVQGGGERRGKPSVEEVEALVAAYPLTDALAHPPPHPTPSAPPLPSAAPSEGLAQPAASAPSPPPSARLSLLHSALADARQWVQAANEMLTRGPASCEVQEVEAMVARGMALQVCVHDKCHQLSTVIASHREWVSEVQQLLAPRLPAPTSPPPLLPRAPATTLAHLKGLQVRGSSSVVASGEARQVQQAVAALDDWLVACCAALRGGSGDEGARGGGEGAQGEGSVAPEEGKGLHGEGKGRVCEEEVVRKLKHMHSSVQAALHRISSLARRTAALSHLTALPAQPPSASANAPHPAVLAGSAVGATADAVAAAASPAATAPTATAPAHAPAPGVAPAVAAAVRGAPEASEAPVPAPPGAAAAAVAGSVSSSDTVCWCAVLHRAHPACAASAGFSGGSDGQAVVGGQAGGGGGDVRVRGKRSGGRRAAAVVCGAVGRESGAGGAGMSWEKREEKAGEARGDREGNMGAVRLEKDSTPTVSHTCMLPPPPPLKTSSSRRRRKSRSERQQGSSRQGQSRVGGRVEG